MSKTGCFCMKFHNAKKNYLSYLYLIYHTNNLTSNFSSYIFIIINALASCFFNSTIFLKNHHFN
ncbi:hypothetical protein BpHYR1_009268 [Brachionus plicatilis]|uniref:Uncharacterized protein n=1 Tax=Brachionus plicatilis TaxID=10195 RepID=A0A3M7Q6Q4_BRAPC|nr:hypothetical protein BpHYR1_009268 [Brachionus plicatilis]